MQLTQIARTSRAVAATGGRLTKRDLLADCLRGAGPEEVAIVVAYLSGELPQRQIGVGYASLRDRPPPAAVAALTVAEVDAAFSRIGATAGKGSVQQRRQLLAALFGRATADEQDFLLRLLTGELRQGALDGVMVDAIAAAAEVPPTEVRRAVMLRGSLGAVAAAALRDGTAGLRAFGLEIGRPVRPMLAQSADSIEAALGRLHPAAVEWKLDGVRVQAHIKVPGAGQDAAGEVRLFTRTLDDITQRVPEVVAALAKLPVRTAVLDGELIALRPGGRPYPFQVTAARAARRNGGSRGASRSERAVSGATRPSPGGGAAGGTAEPSAEDGAMPLSVFLFDVLHLDGDDLIDRPGEERHAALARIAPAKLIMPRVVTAEPPVAMEFFRDAIAHGHEGVVVKSLDTPYIAGRRGAGWVKVKPRHTLDLVVLAAEWGHGRRRGWLSNLHLGARDPATGGFVMLGKTFKGLTDEMLSWQTERLLTMAARRDEWTVYVRPELVVEVAFDGVQRSPRYPGGVALRFARVLRYRPDKSAAEADTIESVRSVGV